MKRKCNESKLAGIFTPNPEIVFKQKTFCWTGESKVAQRKTIISKIEKLGGRYIDRISAKIDYLIVGDNGSPFWAFANYGTKVEKAIDLGGKGCNISIVHELDFWDFIKKRK